MSPWTMSRRLRIGKPRCLILCPATGVTISYLSHAPSSAILRSLKNSIPAEDGSTMLPYTRYGDWYGFPLR